MRKSFVLSDLVVKAVAVLAMVVLSGSAIAENYALVTVTGKQKIKVKQCGSSSVDYSYTLRLRENSMWDLYDKGLASFVPDSGSYTGSLDSRKITATANETTSNTLLSLFDLYAEAVCQSSSVDVDYSTFVYKIKVNKNKTKAHMTTKENLTGFDNQNSIKRKGQYKYSGKGVYSINAFSS